MKTFFRRIHLYLSLAAGIPILLACLTGAFLVFEKDLEKALHHDRYYVTAAGSQRSAEELKALAVQAFPGHKVNGIKLYGAPDRSAELNLSPAKKDKGGAAGNKEQQQGKQGAPEQKGGGKAGGEKQAGKGPQGPPPGFTVFMNPYTGEVLEKYSYRETFFFQMMALHRWLLGGNDSVGKIIMGVSTFLFMFILITGIILWWPRTRKIMVQRLKIKKDAGFKRLNHDLHIVLGFYTAIFLFIFAFTAMNWSFEWFNDALFAITKSSPKPPQAPKSSPVASANAVGFDKAFAAAQNLYPAAEFYNISAPKDSTETFTVSVLMADAAHENATNSVYVDQFSGEVKGTLAFEQRNAGQRAKSYIKPLHTGSIWGMPTKIIAFVVCLLGVSFPITGVIMWLNRTKKKNRKTEKKVAAIA
ncbi:Uncharacterized iron-regulated membrane protein [Cnuella takakiae]|uniref:Uncharacterized iron-regulated membrane protein n=1 Tax=Cnuella takakiae TaxID=1302690 RepID=A0A1M5B7J3_9BACT|nr:PepSY-associated TM helix domain-containing protein [Cnuella takakiae]OLY93366.1 hypothetical protein BUE76_16880 [Cnuella takakiae]SHF38494.1 Uncharacterized iron-regulated membrane protein [Cnuella takakiae]